MDDEALRDAVNGEDVIGIVPEGVFPRYCEGWFPGEKVIGFMNLGWEDERNAELMRRAVFEEPEKVELGRARLISPLTEGETADS